MRARTEANRSRVLYRDRPCYCGLRGRCITCAWWNRTIRVNQERLAQLGGGHGRR